MPSLSSYDTSLITHPPFSTTSRPRLQALYSDISRQKLSNPASYRSCIEWWRKALETVVASGFQHDNYDRLILKANETLLERLWIERTGKPLALGTIVVCCLALGKNELRAQDIFISRSEFLTATASIYDPGWLPGRIASYVVGRPLWWALEQLGVVGEDGLLTSTISGGRSHQDTTWWGEYVIVPLVEKAAEEVMALQDKKATGTVDRLYSLESFRSEFGSVLGIETSLSEKDARVLLKFLERDRKVLLLDGEVIKFRCDGSGPEDVNSVDRGILELGIAVKKLHKQVEELHARIDQCTQKATVALRQMRKPVAMAHLRLRKQLEELLLKRLGSLNILETTLVNVEAAAGDIEIMKSYESSASILRAILAHPSLQQESIDATLHALAEANTDAREVDEAIRTGGNVAVGVDDADEDELEGELQRLVLEAEKEKKDDEMQRKLEVLDARALPDHTPRVVSDKVKVPVP